MEKFARSGTGDAPGSALLDCKEAGISEQSYYRWRKAYGAHQKGLRCCPPTSVDRSKSVTVATVKVSPRDDAAFTYRSSLAGQASERCEINVTPAHARTH